MSTESKRPKYIPHRGDANVVSIVWRAGLDPSSYATKEFLMQRNGLGALYSLFSGGEMTMNPRDRNAELDKFIDAIAQYRKEVRENLGDQEEVEFHKFERMCGSILAYEVFERKIVLPDSSVAKPQMNKAGTPCIQYAERLIPIRSTSTHESAIPLVIDVGPGLAGRKFVDLLVQSFEHSPFFYVPISNGPFINEFLSTYLKLKYPHFLSILRQRPSFFLGREDGVPAAFQELLSVPPSQEENGYSDIIICNGLASANGQELAAALQLTPQIAKPGSFLLLGSPIRKVHEGGLSFHEQCTILNKGGFHTIQEITHQSGNKNTGTSTISTYAILQKS